VRDVLTARPISRRPRFTIERSSRRCERVPEGLDRFSACLRVENEAGSIAPVLDFDAEFVHEISAIPKHVDDDSAGFTVSEMSSSAFHLRPSRKYAIRIPLRREVLALLCSAGQTHPSPSDAFARRRRSASTSRS
jgi:hypothetical protein